MHRFARGIVTAVRRTRHGRSQAEPVNWANSSSVAAIRLSFGWRARAGGRFSGDLADVRGGTVRTGDCRRDRSARSWVCRPPAGPPLRRLGGGYRPSLYPAYASPVRLRPSNAPLSRMRVYGRSGTISRFAASSRVCSRFAEALELSFAERLRKIVLPAALGAVLNVGLRVAAGFALVVAVTVEIVVSVRVASATASSSPSSPFAAI